MMDSEVETSIEEEDSPNRDINDEIYDFPYPPPIYRETDSIWDSQDIPGIIKREEHSGEGQYSRPSKGTWVKQYLTFKGFAKFLTDIYDNWLEVRLPEQLANISIDFPDGSKIKYLNPHIESPRNKTTTYANDFNFQDPEKSKSANNLGKNNFLPSEAKELNTTYAFSIYATPCLCFPNGNVIPLTGGRILIGEIPLMLRSKYCHLSSMTDSELVRNGEDPDTSRGYFIVEGKKKIIVNFEKIRLNKPLLYKYTKGDVICRTTFESYNGTSIVELSFDKNRKINIFLSSLNYYDNKRLKGSKKLDRNGKKLNVFHIFNYLTLSGGKRSMTYQEILDTYILRFVKPEYRSKITAELSATLWDMLKHDDPLKFLMETMEIPPGKSKDAILEINRILDRDLFPTLNDIIDPFQKNEYKLFNLGFMLARITEYMAGVRQLDNRDLWANKRVESAGRMMEQFFRILWGNLLKKALEQKMKEIYNDKKNILELTSAEKMQPTWLLANLPVYAKNVNYTDLAKSIVNIVKYSNVTELFRNAFSKAWRIRGVYGKENVVQELKTDNKLSALSHLIRLDIESSHQGTVQDIRHMQPDQYGFICSVHTPEGGPCGLVKNLAITTSISKGEGTTLERLFVESITALKYSMERSSDGLVYEKGWVFNYTEENKEEIVEYVENIKGEKQVPDVTLYSSDVGRKGKFFLNGRFLGWCKPDSLYDKIYKMKVNKSAIGSSQQIFSPEISISKDNDDNVNLYTDNSRLIRPIFLVNEKGEDLVYNDLKREYPDHYFNFQDLIDKGAATYIDPEEQTYIKLASFSKNIRQFFTEIDNARENFDKAFQEHKKATELGSIKSKKEIKILELEKEKLEKKHERLTNKRHRKYTHCELHPQAQLGVSASVIPMPQTNQSARNTFQAGMGTQALSSFHSNHRNHFDGKTKLLAFPSNPIASTEMENVWGLDKTPQGQNVIIAIASHLGMTGEDAFIFNKDSIDSNLFQVIKYIPFTAIIMRRDKYRDILRRPLEHEFSSDREKEFYHGINDTGLPDINVELKAGDVVIASFRVEADGGTPINTSITMGTLEEGVVDSVKVTERPDGNLIVRVVLRKVRKPKVGDKFAARNAQKGTISKILRSIDMPWTESGMRPDVIINPHSIPGRMTMEYLIEMLTGKVGAIIGERINATPFEPINMDRFFELLRGLGYHSSGKEIMYSGVTGIPLDIPIFIGPAFFQALRHHVDDKYQARGRNGGIKAVTRQPTEGRSKSGGIRFGEMERDAILAHGASFFLKERLCELSDAFKTVACRNCGNFATPKCIENNIICHNCTDKKDSDSMDKFGRITVPYAFILLRNLLGGLNIELKFEFVGKTYNTSNFSMENMTCEEPLHEDSDEEREDETLILPGDEVEEEEEDDEENERDEENIDTDY